MDENDQKRLRAHHQEIVERIRVEEVQDYMYSKGVLSDEDTEKISNERGITPQEATRRLLRIIKQAKIMGVFKIFCDALEYRGYQDLVKKLVETDPRTVPSPDQDTTDSHSKDELVKFAILQEQLASQTRLILEYRKELDKVKDDNDKLSACYEDLKQRVASELGHDELLNFVMKFVDQKSRRGSGSVDISDGAAREEQVGRSMEKFQHEVSRQASSHAIVEAYEQIALEVGLDIVMYSANDFQSNSALVPSSYAKTMRRAVQLMADKHGEVFEDFLQKLKVNEINGYVTLGKVADEIFKHGPTNWGRIVALYGFGGWLAKHCMKSFKNPCDSEAFAKLVGEYLGGYVATNIGPWIKDNGGWDAFQSQFGDSSASTSAMPLLVTAVGLTAIYALVGTRLG